MAVEDWCSLSCKSRWHLEQRFCVAGLPKKPQLLTHNRGAWHRCSSAISLQNSIYLTSTNLCGGFAQTDGSEEKIRSNSIWRGKEKNTVFGWEQGKPGNLRRKYMKEKKSTSTYKDWRFLVLKENSRHLLSRLFLSFSFLPNAAFLSINTP